MAEFEGVKEPPPDDDRPWRLVIQPRSEQPSNEQSSGLDPDPKADLEELFRHAPGAYPGTWVDDEE